MKRFLITICAVFVGLAVISGKCASAEEHLVEASGDYVMDSRLDETPASATARAREEAKRAATEKAGVYLQSYSKMVDFELDYDEVKTVAARLLKIQGESSKVEVIDDNLLKFTVSIKALVDDNNDAILKTIMSDRQSLEEAVRRNNELQKEYDDLKRQMENLKNNYDSAGEIQRSAIKNSVAQNTNYFNAVRELAAGNDFYLQGNYARALECYDNALRLNPQSAEAYNNRGLTYYHLNRFAEAVSDFDKAIAINPAFAQAYNNRGIVRYAQGQPATAISDYTTAIQFNPNFAYALNNRGNAYAMTGQYQNALNDLQTAVSLAKNDAEIHNNLGSVYFSTKRYNDAVAEYTRAIQLNPNYSEAYYNRGAAYYAQGKYVDALPDAKRAADLNPADSANRDLYNKVSRKLGR